MRAGQLRGLLRSLTRLVEPGEPGRSDAHLLGSFVDFGDESAFELLLWRYGPMVLGVCRRVLRHEQDAEDAFQATFLTLARKAGSVNRREALAGWLSRVAYRAALRARSAAERGGCPEADLDPAAPQPPGGCEMDVRALLDEEVQGLPAKYRLPVVLCHLQGLSYPEAARQLGCPEGTLATRLHRARDLLRRRLVRRGVGVSVGAVALEQAAAGAVPAALVRGTLAVALAGAARAASGVIPPRVAELSEGVCRAMVLSKVKSVGAAVMLALVLGVGVGALGMGAAAPRPQEQTRGVGRKTARDGPVDAVPRDLVEVRSPLTGSVVMVGREVKAGEATDPGQVVTEHVWGKKRQFHRLRVGDIVEKGQVVTLLDEHEGPGDDSRGVFLPPWRFLAEGGEKDEALPLHRLKSPVDGVVHTIRRKGREAVRRGEVVLVIRITVKVRKEAKEEGGRPARDEERERVNVPSERSGKLLVVGTEVGPRDKVPADERVEVEVPVLVIQIRPREKVPPAEQFTLAGKPGRYRRVKDSDDLDADRVQVARRKFAFRRLRVGDKVRRSQLVAVVNPALAANELDVKRANLRAAAAEVRVASKTKEEAKKRYDSMTAQLAKKPRSISQEEYRAAKLTWERYIEEEVAREAQLSVVQLELRRAQTALMMHLIRSPLTGVVRRLNKRTGEAVKALDTVLQVEAAKKR
jgi:RNA polymerase sigma factor (sigma-70 family)